MKINRLILKDFRSYIYGDFSFSDTTNVIIGQNAQGKTNLIEAIYLLSVAKSFRTRSSSDLIRFGCEFAKIAGQISDQRTRKNLEMVILENGRKAKINGNQCKKTSEFVGHFNVVVFTPDDLFFVKGSPKNRRRFMDIELSKISFAYLTYNNQYMHYLKERNTYLKNAAIKHQKDEAYLEIITAQMMQSEIEVARRRKVFIEKINHFAQEIYAEISNQQEKIELKYQTFFTDEKNLKEIYLQDEKRDYHYASTTHGIHKDDIVVLINGKDASLYASQGQQRSIVLAIKIALLKYIYQEIGEYPVLLLDDVLSELDTSRQNLLLNLVSDEIQTFITTTSIDGIEHDVIKKAKKIEIKKERG